MTRVRISDAVRSIRRLTITLGIIAIALGLVLTLTGERWSLSRAQASAQEAAHARALASRTLLSSELQKFRLLPLVLADYPDVQTALDERSPEAIARLNSRLELIAGRTDAAVIYVIARDGRTIAASNWRLPTSFVGQNYGFRRYFSGALNGGAAEQFALGTVSRRPGLFLARRIADRRGVVVVKIEFATLERSWARQPGATIVRDANGVVIMTSRPEWRLRTSRKLSADLLEELRKGRMYGEHGPLPLAPVLSLPPNDDGIAQEGSERRFAVSTVPVPVVGWTLSALEPIEPALAAAKAQVRIAALVVALVFVVLAAWLLRSREQRAMRDAARRELEHQVQVRTAELQGANERLVHESRERERNEARLRQAREDLAQSNRLATLGQITAGVAHEINQPLYALRAFAENAGTYLKRGKRKNAESNLDQIVTLSDRIGEITSELRLFARRDGGKGPTDLAQAIDGSLLLLADRLRQHRIVVDRSGPAEECMVAIDRQRLEQILINLLQNAADAVAETTEPRIAIVTRIDGEHAWIAVTDNGAGVTKAQEQRLFSSFATDKPNGLGLGLVISRDLAREIGGELTYEPDGEGTTFLLCLPLI